MAAFEGKWLVVSGCVQVDAGKSLIIAVSLSSTQTQDTDFLAEFNGGGLNTAATLPFTLKWHWREGKWPQPQPHSETLLRRAEQF